MFWPPARIAILILVALGLPLPGTGQAAALGRPAATGLPLWLPFVETGGRPADPAIRVASLSPAGSVGVTASGEVVSILPGPAGTPPWVLRERLAGGRPQLVMDDPAVAGRAALFRGRDPGGWQGGLPTRSTVSIRDAGQGAWLELVVGPSGVERLFHVAPGTDPATVRMAVAGVEAMAVAADGSLTLNSGRGQYRLSPPRAFQEDASGRQPVAVAFRVEPGGYGFAVGDYDPSRELVIDPILAGTFVAATAPPEPDLPFTPLAVDGEGNIIVAAAIPALALPAEDGGWATGPAGGLDILVAKLDPGLSRLLAWTLIGGAGDDWPRDLAIAANGSVRLAGVTSSPDFPATSGSQPFAAGFRNAFVLSLDRELQVLEASLLLGGGDAVALAHTPMGELVVTGRTPAPDFSATPGSLDTSLDGAIDAFVTVCDTRLQTILASTFLGGSGGDMGMAVAVEDDGSILVLGVTDSPDFPAPAGIQPLASRGELDLFLARLDPGLSRILDATLLGGSGNDLGQGLVVAANGSVFVTGATSSPDFPVTGGSSHRGGEEDLFVAWLDPSLRHVTATLAGGSGPDRGLDLALDSQDRLLVVGQTGSADLPVSANALDPSLSGGSDLVVAAFDRASLGLLQMTYLGGSGGEQMPRLAVEAGGRLLLAGLSDSPDLGLPPAAWQPTPAPGPNALLLALEPGLTGDLAPVVALGPAAPAWPAVLVGSTASLPLTIRNSGNTVLALEQLTVAGSQAAEFRLQEDTCSGRLLPPDGVCSLQLAFTPAAAGERQAVLAIPSNALPRLLEVSLTGTGQLPASHHTLVIFRDGSGRGTVRATDRTIDCGSLCSAAFAHGTRLTLEAVPDPGSVFEGWVGGGCAGTGACSVSVDEDLAVKATFRSTGPQSDARANGGDDPLTVSRQETVAFSIRLTANEALDLAADWWIVLATPAGAYSWVYPKGWRLGVSRAFRAPLFDLDETTLLASRLPAGSYGFFFGVSGYAGSQTANVDDVQVVVR
ncbi:MAG: choice-of-anchor D domain-containing protein [Thermodesulfobacteriota bacterium]